jgi:HEAT repeat protein
MLAIADRFRHVLVPFLLVGTAILALVLIGLLVARGIDELRFRRRQRRARACQPLLDRLLHPDATGPLDDDFLRGFARYDDVLAQLLVAPARVATGSMIDRLREAASRLGLLERWRGELQSRHWWMRAEAARALGLLRETTASPSLLAALDDDHEEVRASAVEALGYIGNADAIPVLLSKFTDQSRHQRVRVVESLRCFGSAAVPPLLAYDNAHPEEAATVAGLLGIIGHASAVDHLLHRAADDRPAVRTAALQALGSIGLDDRSYYHVLRALMSDAEPEVRAMAARALGRSGRRDAMPYLDRHLTDDWVVGAQCGAALKALGARGHETLLAHLRERGAAGDLARRMLFDTSSLALDEGAVAS